MVLFGWRTCLGLFLAFKRNEAQTQSIVFNKYESDIYIRLNRLIMIYSAQFWVSRFFDSKYCWQKPLTYELILLKSFKWIQNIFLKIRFLFKYFDLKNFLNLQIGWLFMTCKTENSTLNLTRRCEKMQPVSTRSGSAETNQNPVWIIVVQRSN